MKYTGSWNELEYKGFKLNKQSNFYIKAKGSSVIFVHTKTREVEYAGKNSLPMLNEIIKGGVNEYESNAKKL